MNKKNNDSSALNIYTGNNLPARVASRQLAIAAQLQQEIERKRWVAILKKIPHEDAVALLSSKLALDFKLIERYNDFWDWERLSSNDLLPWSIELIERFEARWDWKRLSYKDLPWSIDLIERFEDRWNWKNLSGNETLPWSIEVIERYQNRLDWGMLSRNEALPWSDDLIKSYEDRWDWVQSS